MDLQDGAVRLPMAWDSPAEHFALVGDLMLRLKSEGSKMLWLAGKNGKQDLLFLLFFSDFRDLIFDFVSKLRKKLSYGLWSRHL